MAEKILRVGVAGQGRSGFSHASSLFKDKEHFELVAVADRQAARRKEARDTFGCRAYRDYTELIKNADIDVFVNSLPSLLHPKGTVAALRAGLNVVCEKPAAQKVRDFDRMTEAAKKVKRVLAVFQNNRFVPYFQKTLEVIDSGVLGRIVHCRINRSGWSRRWDWQTRQDCWGGNLNNTGPHLLDQAVVLFGNRMPKVFSLLESTDKSFGDADDFAAVTLHGKNAPVVEILLSSCQAYPQGDYLYVGGTRGGLRAGAGGVDWKYIEWDEAPRQKLDKSWTVERQYCRETLPWIEKSWKPEGPFDSNAAFYANFYEVMTGKAKLVVKHAEVRRQVAILEECHRQNPLPRYRKKYGKALKPIA